MILLFLLFRQSVSGILYISRAVQRKKYGGQQLVIYAVLVILLRAPFYDAVFVNLWVTPLGFPLFERILFFFNKKVIYDIDDMLFIDKRQQGKISFIQRLKGRRKPVVLMKHSQICYCMYAKAGGDCYSDQ